MNTSPLPPLIQATLRHTDPYTRIDPLFSKRLRMGTTQFSDSTLPEDFLEPFASWTPNEHVTISERNLLMSTNMCKAVSEATSSHLQFTQPKQVRVRVYQPKQTSPKAWVLWLHGGGFAEGSLDSPEAHAVCAELSARHPIACVSVDYQLATDTQQAYPHALLDILCAWQWMVERATEQAAEHTTEQTDNQATQCTQAPQSKYDAASPMPLLCIGGTSAGATLAACATQLIVDLQLSQLPVPQAFLGAYGVYHTMQKPLIEEDWNVNTRILPQPLRFTPQLCRQMYQRYADQFDNASSNIGNPSMPSNTSTPKYIIPAFSMLENFPPSALLCCEFDDLAPSSIAFARQLQQAGVPVSITMAPGVLHGYFNWYPSSALPQSIAGIEYFTQRIDAIYQQLHHSHYKERGEIHF